MGVARRRLLQMFYRRIPNTRIHIENSEQQVGLWMFCLDPL